VASSNRRASILPPEHGTDVFIIILAVYSLHRYMDWYLVKAQWGVSIGRISNRVAFLDGHSREILELLPSSMKQEFPTSGTPKQAATFISRFMKVKGKFPQSDFWVPGWMYSTTTLGR